MKRKIVVDEWHGAYPSNWKGVIVPEAMAHPAKYSSKLIRRIYEHMFKQEWIQAGDRVLDPFGGVALGALDATRLGLHWMGIELELKFFRLGSGMDCSGFDKAYWKRYHTRGRKWNELNICPDCGNLLDGNGITNDLFGVYQRLIPAQGAHHYRGNIESWEIKYPHIKGTAQLLHGDSRYLLSVIGESVQVSVSSPPYAETLQSGNYEMRESDRQHLIKWGRNPDAPGASPAHDYGSTPGQLGAMKNAGFDAMISSPPFLQSEGGTPEPKPGGAINVALYKRHAAGNAKANGYGQSDGQLSSMRDGGFKVALSSPPYSAMQVEKNAKSIDRTKQYEIYKKSGGGQTFEQFCHTQDIHSQGYGNSEGQLSAMPANSFNVALSSPPYAEARIGQESGQEHCGHGDQYGGTDGQLGSMHADGFDAAVSSPPFEKAVKGGGIAQKGYQNEATRKGTQEKPFDLVGKRSYMPENQGTSDSQLANDSGDDFWLAARVIVEQVYLALAPGGHAVWVVKDYVKNKNIVPFSDQWRQLCEAVGFVTLHEHHAMLVHHKGTQHLLEGGMIEKVTQSKSFFRRLAENHGSPHIDWEVVYCMEKPQ